MPGIEGLLGQPAHSLLLNQLSYAGSTKSTILYINLKREIGSKIFFLERKESMHMRSLRCVCVFVSVKLKG